MTFCRVMNWYKKDNFYTAVWFFSLWFFGSFQLSLGTRTYQDDGKEAAKNRDILRNKDDVPSSLLPVSSCWCFLAPSPRVILRPATDGPKLRSGIFQMCNSSAVEL